MQNVLIIGATSAIAEATARLYARLGARMYLMARDGERLAIVARDLKIRGAASVAIGVCDFNDFSESRMLLDRAVAALDAIDIALMAHGTLPDQRVCQEDPGQLLNALNDNAVSSIMLLSDLANRMVSQGFGTIAVISSVAGDRGRQSNYVYGSAKALLSVFTQGLRNRLYGSGVHVLTVKPGMVDTPMTAGFRKGVLWSRPDVVARGIVRAITRRRNVVYLPAYWRVIMLFIRVIPESLFKRLNL